MTGKVSKALSAFWSDWDHPVSPGFCSGSAYHVSLMVVFQRQRKQFSYGPVNLPLYIQREPVG